MECCICKAETKIGFCEQCHHAAIARLTRERDEAVAASSRYVGAPRGTHPRDRREEELIDELYRAHARAEQAEAERERLKAILERAEAAGDWRARRAALRGEEGEA